MKTRRQYGSRAEDRFIRLAGRPKELRNGYFAEQEHWQKQQTKQAYAKWMRRMCNDDQHKNKQQSDRCECPENALLAVRHHDCLSV